MRENPPNEALALAADGAPLAEVTAALARDAREQVGAGARAAVFVADRHARQVLAGAATANAQDVHAGGGASVPQTPVCDPSGTPRTPNVVPDITQSSDAPDAAQAARDHGFRACWSYPIVASSTVLGTLEVYCPEPREPAPAELESLEALSRTAALAIQRHRDEEDRAAWQRLHAERDRLLEMVASGRSPEDCLTAFCEAVSRLCSGTRAAVVIVDAQGRAIERAIAPELDPSFSQGLAGAAIDEPVTGALGEAVSRGAPTQCADVAHDDTRSQPWRHLCLTSGIRACYCVPAKRPHTDEAVATVCLGFDEARAPGAWDDRLAEFGAYLVSIVLERDRTTQALATITAESERQERLYEAIVSSTPDLVYVFDLDYRFLYANEALLQMWGRSYEDSIGRGLRELGYEPWHADMHEREIDRVVATKEPVRGEVAFPHATLGRRIYDYIFVPVINEHGEVEAVSGTTRDITERKQREDREQFLADLNGTLQRLADPEEVVSTAARKLGEYLDVDRCVYGEIEPDGEHVLVTGGYTRGDAASLIGRWAMSDFGRDALQLLRENEAFVVSDVEADERLSASDRQYYEHAQVRSAIGAPLYKEGVFVGLMAVHQRRPRDWTPEEVDLVTAVVNRCWEVLERARVTRALREREQFLSELVENTPECIKVVAPDGKIQEANPAGVEMAEADSADQVLDEEVFEFIAPEHRDAVRAFHEQICRGEHGTLQYDLTGLNGTRRHCETNSAPLRGPDGTISHLALTRDVTARVEAEQALRRSEKRLHELNQTLEERVRARTRDLQRQTELLRDLAAELTTTEQRERRRFAAMLHDDLQQWVVAARLRLASIVEGASGAFGDQLAEVQDLLDECLATSRNLTRQLRPPVLYEDGLVPALGALAGDIEKLYGLQVSVDAEQDIPDLGDDRKALLFDATRELLINTAKHAGVESARVEARRTGQAVTLAVRDQGRGFDLAEAERTARDKGFGLFSIRERLAAFGGETRIHSVPDAGTRVEMEMPVSRSAESGSLALTGTETVDAVRAQGIGDADKTRVLVVDDHAIVRHGIARLLSEHEQIEEVAEAGNGTEAIHTIERAHPDVILMDVNMPGMSGVEATREIRQRWPDAVVVGLSVQEDTPTARSMTDAGAAGFLPKSGDPNQMVKTVLELAAERD